MITRRAATIGLLSMGLVVTTMAVARADSGVGFTSVVIGVGQINRSPEINIVKGTDVVTVQNTIAPAGSSGWHSHPGIAVLVVQSGAVTLHTEDVTGGPCRTRTYSAGQVFIERPDHTNDAVNSGSVDAVVVVTFFNVPHGGLARIDRPNPGNCP